VSQRADDAGRRGQIVRESARLFREKGYDGTSVRDIAAATGLQSGSWVYHFRTKQEILAAVMAEGLQQALERIEAIGRERLAPREHFRALLRTHLDTLLGPGQDFIPVLLYEWRSLEPEARPRIIALQRRNPHFGCVRIAQQISQAFGVEIGKDVVRRALAGLTPAQRSFALRPAPAELDHYGWQRHCRGQFELPIAA